jgi:hypothetical protein
MLEQEFPYGLFPSPLTPRAMGRGLTFGEVAFSGRGDLLWRRGFRR